MASNASFDASSRPYLSSSFTSHATSFGSWLLQPATIITLIPLYLLIVRALRAARYRSIQQLHQAPLAAMTIETAQRINDMVTMVEFPFMAETGTYFALFRTYGIPTISDLLLKTGQLGRQDNVAKRYSDTAVLISETIERRIGSKEWIAAVARMNSIHGEYINAGKISNDDMLYTLSLFAGEPDRWIKMYEWRNLSVVERCAIGLMWKTAGEAMNISFAKLSAMKKHLAENDGQLIIDPEILKQQPAFPWTDGQHWLNDVLTWAESYEKEVMLPDEVNHAVAEHTANLFLYSIPASLQSFGRKVIYALMDERLAQAMLYPIAPDLHKERVKSFFAVRATITKYLLPPRINHPFFIPQFTTGPNGPDGRSLLTKYDAAPYYIKPTIWNRWLSPQAIQKRIMGQPLPGDDGDKYCPMGYLASEVGPRVGLKKQDENEAAVKQRLNGKCPMGM